METNGTKLLSEGIGEKYTWAMQFRYCPVCKKWTRKHTGWVTIIPNNWWTCLECKAYGYIGFVRDERQGQPCCVGFIDDLSAFHLYGWDEIDWQRMNERK